MVRNKIFEAIIWVAKILLLCIIAQCFGIYSPDRFFLGVCLGIFLGEVIPYVFPHKSKKEEGIQ